MTTKSTPAPSVLAGVRQAFVAHAPFSAMRDADVDRIVRATTLRYYAPGQTILVPSAEPPRYAFFIRQGSVHGQPAESPGGLASSWEGTAGELFPLSPLLAKRGVTRVYTAVQDTFLLAFPASVFDVTIERSPVFADFCTRTLSHLLDLARASLQAEYAAAVTEQRGSGTPLAMLLRHSAVTVDPATPIGDALRLMESRRIGSLPVVDAARRPLGIFTRQDVIGRLVLKECPLSRPIGDVMSAPVVTLPAEATAADAALEMAAHGIRHVVVVDDTGAVSGVVSERDLFSLQRLSVRELVSDIRRARDVATLRQSAADVRALAHALVAQGVASGQLTRMIASLNDQILHRLLDLVAPRHPLGGLTLCWIGMGSEGRGEQTIATDQDNGLIFVVPDGHSAEAVRERLLPFAREVNESLDVLGYPLCKGGVMAMNPRWCASLGEWQAAFTAWIERGDPESLLAASIFFDFRSLWGDPQLAHTLRREVAAQARANPRFLKQMTDNALRNRPPLNWYGELQADPRVHGIDLKLHGTALIVDGARIFALASGVFATNTITRLVDASGPRGIPSAEVRAWSDAFEFLQLIRLRTQHRRAAGVLAPSANPNVVPLTDLSDLDRRIIREAMRQVRTLQQRLQLDYPG